MHLIVISLIDSNSQLRVFNLSDNEIKLLNKYKNREFFSNVDSVQVNDLFTCKDQPKRSDVFRMETQAALEGTDSSRLQSNHLIILSILLLKYFSETQTTWGSVTDSNTK